MAPLSASLAGKQWPPKSAINGKENSFLKCTDVDTCHFQPPGSKTQETKGSAMNPILSIQAGWEPWVFSQYAVQMLCRSTCDKDISMEGKQCLLELIGPALWMTWKWAIYFPNSLNINLPWIKQSWAICQPPVHHATLILSLFFVVCICVFTSISTPTEHTGTYGQDTHSDCVL